MGDLRSRATLRWTELGLAARAWWIGLVSVATAAVLVLGAVSLADATSQPAAKSTGTTGGSMAGMSMAGSSGSSGNGKQSTPKAASATSPICANVKHTTVMSDGMVMAPVPSAPPTTAQKAAAATLVDETKGSLTKYASLSAATAAGYVPATNPNRYEVHYANWQIVKSGDVLDPSHPSSLVYANTVHGPVLLGAMYLGAGPCQPGPDVGGSLTQWHAHDNLCLSASHQVVGKTTASGSCTVGSHNTGNYFMLHVWVQPTLAATHQFQPDLTRAELVPIIRGQA